MKHSCREQHNGDTPNAHSFSSWGSAVYLWYKIGVGLGILLLFAGCATSPTPAANTAIPQTQTAANDPGKSGQAIPPGPQGDKPIYWQTVRQTTANSLHLSEEQVKLKVTTPAGTDAKGAPVLLFVADVARQQGITSDQLRPLELAAVQQGYTALVVQRDVTQQQSQQDQSLIQTWSNDLLDGYITSAFRDH